MQRGLHSRKLRPMICIVSWKAVLRWSLALGALVLAPMAAAADECDELLPTCIQETGRSFDIWPLRARRLGRMSSYRLNAYDDYAISERITRFVADGTMPSGEFEVDARARSFIEDRVSGYPLEEARQRLVVVAYTLRWLNGYADQLWAIFLERIHLIRPRFVSPEYMDAEGKRPRLFFWLFTMRGDTEPIEEYARDYVDFDLPPEAVGQEIIRVQEANGAANQQTADAILDAALDAQGNVKVDYVRDTARGIRHTEPFLKGAAAGQTGAGNWDRAFTRIVQRGYGAEHE